MMIIFSLHLLSFLIIILMFKMKAAVYDALDFSLARDQQRTLSQQLEEVISKFRIETI